MRCTTLYYSMYYSGAWAAFCDISMFYTNLDVSDGIQAGAPVQGKDSSGKNRTFYKTMTFAERAQAMGYKTQVRVH